MNSFVTILLILSIIGLAAFGFFAVLCENGAGHNCCIAEIIAKTVTRQACPQNNALAYIDFHFGALKSLSTAVFDAPLFLFLAIVLLGLISVVLSSRIFEHKINSRFSLFLYYLSQDSMEGVFQFKKSYLRWLALRERRDACLNFWTV